MGLASGAACGGAEVAGHGGLEHSQVRGGGELSYGALPDRLERISEAVRTRRWCYGDVSRYRDGALKSAAAGMGCLWWELAPAPMPPLKRGANGPLVRTI